VTQSIEREQCGIIVCRLGEPLYLISEGFAADRHPFKGYQFVDEFAQLAKEVLLIRFLLWP